MPSRHSIAVLAATLLAGGCTTLKVSEPTSDYRTRQGIVYYLPFTQFEVTTNWAVSCDDAGVLSLTPKFEVKSKSGADPNGIYVIDYRSLSAVTKTSNVKVDFYDSGAIKSINASAEDRTGEMAAKLISGVAKIAKVALVSGADDAKCSAGLLTVLGEIESAQGTVDTKTESLKRETKLLDALTATVVREGGKLSAATQAAIRKQVGEVVAQQIELNAANAVLDEKLEAATASASLTFPEISSETQSGSGAKIPLSQLKQWIAAKSDEDSAQFEARVTGIQAAETVWFALDSRADFARTTAQASAADRGDQRPDAKAGIRYRIGMPALLKACKRAACVGGAVPGSPIKSIPVTMTQAQSTFFLPFASKAFTNAALTATFSEAGVLTSAGYEQKKAPGEVVAGLVEDAAGQAATLIQSGRDARKTETELVEEQTKLAKAQKELADARLALEEAPTAADAKRTAALSAQTAAKLAEIASVNADIAMIEAQKKLALAQAESAAGTGSGGGK